MFDGLIHGQPLGSELLAGHDDINEIPAAQTLVSHVQEAVSVRRKKDANHFCLLIDDVIDEAGILMTEAVVILSPHVRGQQIVEGGDGTAPGNVVAHLQPLRMLIEHGIDNMDERFIAGKKSVPARQ